jgi:mannose-6-phosphate isomerase-like protein (cupin superfamily)
MDRSQLGEVEPFTTLDGSSIRELAHTREQSLAEATVAPGAETESHYHRTSEELYFFTAGAGRMKFGDEVVDVTGGDCITIPPGVEHKLWNSSDTDPLVLLCCCSPAYSHDDTVVT